MEEGYVTIGADTRHASNESNEVKRVRSRTVRTKENRETAPSVLVFVVVYAVKGSRVWIDMEKFLELSIHTICSIFPDTLNLYMHTPLRTHGRIKNLFISRSFTPVGSEAAPIDTLSYYIINRSFWIWFLILPYTVSNSPFLVYPMPTQSITYIG